MIQVINPQSQQQVRNAARSYFSTMRSCRRAQRYISGHNTTAKYRRLLTALLILIPSRGYCFFLNFPKCRTPMADGMSFRGCLSGGGDIFSKSVEKQVGANRTFATGGRCHGWQLEPCPCGLEPLLTFRQKIPTGRPYIEEGHSVRHGRSWICFTNSQFCNLYHQSRKYVYGVQIL